MKNFRTYNLAKNFYQAGQRLGFKGAIRNQFERASLSVVLNLAEGSAKPSAKERRKFYYTALASFRETQAILDLTNHQEAIKQADILGAHLFRLCKATK